MIDLHTHSLLSDGELLPSELARRAKVKGYKVIGISDHVDASNIESVIPSMLRLAENLSYYEGITVVPGVEITHVPRGLIREMITVARRLGAVYVIVHGETIAEPVEEGTNREAIEAHTDILAHPGIITEEDAKLAGEKDVLLEISGRKGHSLGNGRVGRIAEAMGAKLIFDTDAHSPSDLVTRDEALKIVRGAGLSEEAFYAMQRNAAELLDRVLRR